MTDPTTMTDATLAAAIRRLEDETAFRAAVKELRRPTSAKRLAVLRTLSTAEKWLHVPGPTDWLARHGLVAARATGFLYGEKHHYAISDLGRRALAAITEPA